MKRAGSRRITGSILVVLGGALLVFLLVPIVVLLFGATPADVVEAVQEEEVQRSVAVTLESAVAATVLGLLGGVPLAYLLARHRFRGKRAIESLLGLPVIIPHTSAGVALVLTYGARGPAGALFAHVGIFFTDHLAGVVVAMLFVGVPFLVSSAREAIALVSVDLEQAALCDGASLWQAMWLVTLPLARRGIAVGALLMWARGISEFGAVVLLAYHPRTLSVLIYERFQGFGLERATPLAAMLVAISVLVFAVVGGYLSRQEEDERGPATRGRRSMTVDGSR